MTLPFILAKLWSVMPKLFQRPVASSFAGALERISLLALVASALVEFATGILDIDGNFPASVNQFLCGALLRRLGVRHVVCAPRLRQAPDGPPRLSRARRSEAPTSGAAADRAGATGRRRARSGQPRRAHGQPSWAACDGGRCVADHLRGAGRRVDRWTAPKSGVARAAGARVRNGSQRLSGEPHRRHSPDHARR